MELIITKYNITPPSTQQGIVNYIYKGYHFSEPIQNYSLGIYLMEDIETDERFEFDEVYKLASSSISFKMINNNVLNIMDVLEESFQRQPNGEEYVYRVRFIDGNSTIFDGKLELESCNMDETKQFWHLEAVEWIKFFMDKWSGGYVRLGITGVESLLNFLFSETPFNINSSKIIISGDRFFTPEQYSRLVSYYYSPSFLPNTVGTIQEIVDHFVRYLISIGLVREIDYQCLVDAILNEEFAAFFIASQVNPADESTGLFVINRDGTYNLKTFVIDCLKYFASYLYIDSVGDVNFVNRNNVNNVHNLDIADDTSYFKLGENIDYKGVFIQYRDPVVINRSGYFVLSLDEQKFTINSEAPEGYLDLTNSFLMITENINGVLTIVGHKKDNEPRVFAYDRTVSERIEDYQDVLIRKILYENELYLGNKIYEVNLLDRVVINGVTYTIKTMRKNLVTKFALAEMDKGEYTVGSDIESVSAVIEDSEEAE